MMEEMSSGALQHSRAQIALSITGIAGPDGGSVEKPVGTVCLGWAGPGATVHAVTRRFDGDRDQVRRQAVIAALQALFGDC